MMKRWVLVIAFAVLFLASGFSRSGLERFVPANRSVTSAKLADGSIGYNPLQYDRGTRLDTPYVSIMFDDGKDIWDSCERWVDAGLVFCFGIPYNIVRNAVADSMTAAEVREAFSKGCEITNHNYTGAANWGSRIGGTDMERVIDRTAAYFLDTLRVGCPGTDPLQIGYNYAGGDWREWLRLRIAERHVYAAGGMVTGTIQFENDAGLAVKTSNSYVRWGGNLLGNYMDSVLVSAYRGRSAAPGTTMVRTFRNGMLIWPGSFFDEYRVPGGISHGPSPADGGGTIQQLNEAKAVVRFAMKHGAAIQFGFHHWDSVYTNGYPDSLWMSDFCAWLVEKQDSGLIKVKTVWDIVRDYGMRPPASDWNFFPDPACTTFSWEGSIHRPDGWMYGGTYDYSTLPWTVERGESAGFGGDTVCAEWRSGSSQFLGFARVVPPDCYVTFSALVNASQAAEDSVRYDAWLDVRAPNTITASLPGAYGLNQPYTSETSANNALFRINAVDRIKTDQGVGAGAGYFQGLTLNSQGALQSSRYLLGGNVWDPLAWKELYLHQYVGDGTVAIITLKQGTTATYDAGEGLRIAYVSFSIKRRLGSQPVRN